MDSLPCTDFGLTHEWVKYDRATGKLLGWWRCYFCGKRRRKR